MSLLLYEELHNVHTSFWYQQPLTTCIFFVKLQCGCNFLSVIVTERRTSLKKTQLIHINTVQTFVNKRFRTIIDLTLAAQDRRWLRFNLKTTTGCTNPRGTRVRWPATPAGPLDTKQIVTQAKELTANILNSCNSACPLTDSTPRQGQHWWGPELERLRRRVRRPVNRAMNKSAYEN